MSEEEKQIQQTKSKFSLKINWKILIVGYLTASLVPLALMLLSCQISGESIPMGELFMALVSFQMGAFLLAGFLMGYWAGTWSWLEIMIVFVMPFNTNLKTIITESPELKSLNLLLLCLALYGGSLSGGVGLGILLKKIIMKNKPLTSQESEDSRND